MTLTPFEASKLVEWAEHVLEHGVEAPMPRAVKEVDRWIAGLVSHDQPLPFPKFDTEQPYTWEG